MLEPARIGKYRIIAKIGQGGMADVYQAEDVILGRTVAMKVLPFEFARNEELIFRFEKEVRSLAALDHPNIVTIYDVGNDDGHHFYTMTLLPNDDLKKRIYQGIAPSNALEILKQIAEALRFAHAKGVIHRDIKPQNILFDSQQRPVLTDLGIAKAIGSQTHMTKTGMIMGTPRYMSPEQARGKPADGRSDLYSLGVVFYEMLTGKVPYDADDTFAVALMHINDPIPMLPASLSIFQPLIDLLMAKRPEDRLADASQLLAMIQQLQQGKKIQRPQPTMRMMPSKAYYDEAHYPTMMNKRPRRPVKKSGKTWWAAALVAALVLGGAYLAARQPLPLFRSKNQDMPARADQTKRADARSEAQQQMITATKITVPEPTGPSPAEIARQKEITRLLDLARKDIEALQLTTPKGDNAFEHIKGVLALEGGNDAAKLGLKKIVDKYLELTEGAIIKEKYEDADHYLTEASMVKPGDAAIAAARKKLEEITNARAEQQEIEQQRIALEKAEAEKQAQAEAEQKARAEAENQAAFEQHMSSGLTALENKDKTKAMESFQAALELFPEDPLAIEGLQSANAMSLPPKPGETYTNPFKMTFVFIGPGSFTMGSPPTEPGRDGDEKPHKVTLTKGYWLQTTEMTQAQWQAVMNANPSRFKTCGGDCPVENISWEDTQSLIQKINQINKDKIYRLPTEAEWEYAVRAGGGSSKYFFGNQNSLLENFGWYDRNAGGKTHPVAQKSANAWGLFDMYGNVWEWCQDGYNAYPDGEATDPVGKASGPNRVVRGGSWFSNMQTCRSAVRYSLVKENRNFYLGVRLAATE